MHEHLTIPHRKYQCAVHVLHGFIVFFFYEPVLYLKRPVNKPML